LCLFFKLWGLFRVIGYIGIQNIGPFYYILLENHYEWDMGYFCQNFLGQGYWYPTNPTKSFTKDMQINTYVWLLHMKRRYHASRISPEKLSFYVLISKVFKNIRMSCHILLYNCPHNVLSYIITIRLCMLYLFWQNIFLFLWS